MPSFDLESEGMKALLKLTNEQFEYWGNELKRSTSETIKPGDLMDYCSSWPPSRSTVPIFEY